MMFKLSEKSTMLIQQSTLLDSKSQMLHPIAESLCGTDVNRTRKYACHHSRVIAPRGSVYLQINRLLSLKEVKDFISKI